MDQSHLSETEQQLIHLFSAYEFLFLESQRAGLDDLARATAFCMAIIQARLDELQSSDNHPPH